MQPTRIFGLSDWGVEEEKFPGGLAEQELYLKDIVKEQGNEFQPGSSIAGRFGVQSMYRMARIHVKYFETEAD